MNLRTELLPHQRTAVGKLQSLRVGALFMEMGTGKSRTTIELVYRRKQRISNVVWFCPVSLKETVTQEILKHTDTPERDICSFNGKTNMRNVPSVFWYVIGIESMSASKRVIFTANSIINENSLVIVDESSFIKGHASVRTNWITNISKRSRYRLILTGTPISQGVVDLFSQMRFLSPMILGYNSFYSFAANHLEYSDRYPDMIVRAHNTEWLAAKIQPYVYQVTKEECLDLPKKLYDTRYFRMTDEQRYYYEMAKDEILMSIGPDDYDRVTIFRLFTALQQIACGFWNRKRKGQKVTLEFEHKRIDTLCDIVERIPENEKVVIWGKYTYDILNILNRLEGKYGQGAATLFYGDLSEKKRNLQLDIFKSSARFLVANPASGGHGLNLVVAPKVIFYNNSFKYSERLQAEDRVHRIGQIRNVTYFDVECVCGIEKRISQAHSSKGNVVDSFKREVDRVKGNKAKFKELLRTL